MVIPPSIIVEETSSDEVVSEGSNVTLKCRARGHPPPHIQWKREDRKEIPLQTLQGKNYIGTVSSLQLSSLFLHSIFFSLLLLQFPLSLSFWIQLNSILYFVTFSPKLFSLHSFLVTSGRKEKIRELSFPHHSQFTARSSDSYTPTFLSLSLSLTQLFSHGCNC